MPLIGVLISGRGTNLQSILDAAALGALQAEVRVVVSSKADAAGLARASGRGVEALVVERHRFRSTEEYDRALVSVLQERDVDLVCLAGFMRVLSPVFTSAFPRRILNIHPSLLPAFPGLHAPQQAWQYGVKTAGATVHIVDDTLDGGPIVLQEALDVMPDDTPETLAERILEIEHRIYPRAIAAVLAGGWRIEGRRFVR